MVKKIVLDNGARVLLEEVPSSLTAAVGIFVKNGAVNEKKSEAGISHFIEHMLFKGTSTRSARDIAIETDRVGGNMNAYTTKEYTCFYAKVLSEDILTPLSLLTDMYFNSSFDEKDIATEKNVIIEEINMYEDSPEDLVCDLLCDEIFKGSALENSILGTEETVASFTQEQIRKYVESHYTPENTVISIAGNFDENTVLEFLYKNFSYYKRAFEQRILTTIPYRKILTLREKEIEQNHLCFGFPGLYFDHEDIYSLSILSSVFGGAMSSRLFQNLREKRGLCYGIYSFSASHEEAGIFAIHVALAKKSEPEALKEILKEIKSAAGKGFSDDEVVMGKRQVKASFLMGMESTSSRMQSNARREIIKGTFKEPEELLTELQKVTAQDINFLSEKMLDPENISLAVVGECDQENYYQTMLKN